MDVEDFLISEVEEANFKQEHIGLAKRYLETIQYEYLSTKKELRKYMESKEIGKAIRRAESIAIFNKMISEIENLSENTLNELEKIEHYALCGFDEPYKKPDIYGLMPDEYYLSIWRHGENGEHLLVERRKLDKEENPPLDELFGAECAPEEWITLHGKENGEETICIGGLVLFKSRGYRTLKKNQNECNYKPGIRLLACKLTKKGDHIVSIMERSSEYILPYFYDTAQV